MSEFKGTKEEKALHYAENWEEITGLDYEDMSPIEVSEIDYLNGYNQALEDSKYTEMLEMLNKALIIINDLDNANSDMMNELYQTKVYKNFTKHSVFCDEIEQLIKQATEL